jgi:hypothetical protein
MLLLQPPRCESRSEADSNPVPRSVSFVLPFASSKVTVVSISGPMGLPSVEQTVDDRCKALARELVA